MKQAKRPSRATRTDATRRAQLLAAFERSGLSAGAFARQHGLHYTTFCGWRHQRAKRQLAPGFVEVELGAPAVAAGLTVVVGRHARCGSSRRARSPGRRNCCNTSMPPAQKGVAQ